MCALFSIVNELLPHHSLYFPRALIIWHPKARELTRLDPMRHFVSFWLNCFYERTLVFKTHLAISCSLHDQRFPLCLVRNIWLNISHYYDYIFYVYMITSLHVMQCSIHTCTVIIVLVANLFELVGSRSKILILIINDRLLLVFPQ